MKRNIVVNHQRLKNRPQKRKIHRKWWILQKNSTSPDIDYFLHCTAWTLVMFLVYKQTNPSPKTDVLNDLSCWYLFTGRTKNYFWSIIIAVTFCFVIFNLYNITEAYLLHKVHMQIKIQHQTELPFPAVTLCNMNPFRRSAIESSAVFGLQKSGVRKRSLDRRRRQKRATGERRRDCIHWSDLFQ